jgi:hypothetical protein
MAKATTKSIETNLELEDRLNRAISRATCLSQACALISDPGLMDHKAWAELSNMLLELNEEVRDAAGALLSRVAFINTTEGGPVKVPPKKTARKPHWKTVAKAKKLAEAANGAEVLQ